MTSYSDDRNRSVIPRWRPFRLASELGETADSRIQTPPLGEIEGLAARLSDWRSEKTSVHAADVFGLALAAGNPLAVREIAESLAGSTDSMTSLARDLARQALDGVVSPGGVDGTDSAITDFQGGIRCLRQMLTQDPRDALSWMDLALSYTVAGLTEKASSAARVALGLARHDRFVLRSVARLLVHQDRPDAAYALLSREPRSETDPWLMAATIATARAAGRPPPGRRRAIAMADDEAYSEHHRSELRSALGTLEQDAGKVRNARRLYSESLLAPTENAVAQAAWATRRDPQIALFDAGLDAPRSFEARAWTAFQKTQWNEAFLQAARWHQDQPFSARPAGLASYIASSLLEDHAGAEAITRQALRSSPADFTLRNNLVFALALQGKVGQADKEFRKIVFSGLSPREAVIAKATSGLLSFRQGNSAIGRQAYREAIETAQKMSNDLRLQAMALARLAFEEIRAGTEEAGPAKLAALSIEPSLSEAAHDVRALLKRLRETSR